MRQIELRELRGVRQLTEADLACTVGGLSSLQIAAIGLAGVAVATWLWNKGKKKGIQNALDRLWQLNNRRPTRTPTYAGASRPTSTISYID